MDRSEVEIERILERKRDLLASRRIQAAQKIEQHKKWLIKIAQDFKLMRQAKILSPDDLRDFERASLPVKQATLDEIWQLETERQDRARQIKRLTGFIEASRKAGEKKSK